MEGKIDMTIYRVHYVSRSGGHRGFSTFDSLADATARARDLRVKGYRVRVATDVRD